MKRFWSAGLALLLICTLLAGLVPCCAAAEDAPVLDDTKAAVLMDASTGDLLYALNPDTPLYIAGLSTMMTALLAAEAVEREELGYADLIEASSTSHNDITADASIQNIIPGEQMSLENLLYCAIVGGASEACNIIGEAVAGSTSAFVTRMNQRAKELGCTNTHFANCHGLPNEDHYSTARDLGKIAAAFVQHEALMKISGTVSVEIPATNISGVRKLTSSNYILRSDYTRYYYSQACGIKSGYTEHAGYCLASSVKTGDSYVVSVVLGCSRVEQADGFFDIQSFVQTKKLFQWFSSCYSLRDVVSSIEPVAEVPLALGEGTDSVVVCADSDLRLFLPNDLVLSENFTRNITIYSQQEGAEALEAPVYRGQVLGEMTVTSESGDVFGPFLLLANNDVAVSRVELMRQRVVSTMQSKGFRLGLIIVVLIFVLYFVFITVYRVRRSRMRRAQRAQQQEASRRE